MVDGANFRGRPRGGDPAPSKKTKRRSLSAAGIEPATRAQCVRRGGPGGDLRRDGKRAARGRPRGGDPTPGKTQRGGLSHTQFHFFSLSRIQKCAYFDETQNRSGQYPDAPPIPGPTARRGWAASDGKNDRSHTHMVVTQLSSLFIGRYSNSL